MKQPYDRVPGVDAVVLGLTEHDRVKHSSKSTTCEDILRQKHTVRDCGPPLSLFSARNAKRNLERKGEDDLESRTEVTVFLVHKRDGEIKRKRAKEEDKEKMQGGCPLTPRSTLMEDCLRHILFETRERERASDIRFALRCITRDIISKDFFP